MNQYDVAIIGGGPGGYYAAIRLSQENKKVVLFEEDEVGGTCLNRGCIPTKYLLHKSELIHEIRKNEELGLLQTDGSFNWKKIMNGKNKAVRTLSEGTEFLLRKNSVDIVKRRCKVHSKNTVIDDNDEIYEVSNIIISSGSRPKQVKMIGSELTLTSDELLDIEQLPRSIAIIGSGVIGLEMATLFYQLGVKVTVIEKMSGILPNEDKESTESLLGAMKNQMDFYFDANVVRILEKDGIKLVEFQHEDKLHQVTCDVALLVVGRDNNIENLGLEQVGIKTDGKNITTDEFLETTVPNIFAIGDVNGRLQLAHSAYEQAECVSATITGKRTRFDVNKVPRSIFTSPQLSFVGLSEEQVIESKVEYRKVVSPFSSNGKSVSNEATFGFIKVLLDENNEILGASILGENSVELIGQFCHMHQNKIPIDSLCNVVYPHPTATEMVKELAMGSLNKAIHMLNR